MKRSLLVAVFLGLVAAGGCGPADEPTRFTPASAAGPARVEPVAPKPPADRGAPARNIEMH